MARVMDEVAGAATSRAVLSLLQGPGGLQALRFLPQTDHRKQFVKFYSTIYVGSLHFTKLFSASATNANCIIWKWDMRLASENFNTRSKYLRLCLPEIYLPKVYHIWFTLRWNNSGEMLWFQQGRTLRPNYSACTRVYIGYTRCQQCL